MNSSQARLLKSSHVAALLCGLLLLALACNLPSQPAIPGTPEPVTAAPTVMPTATALPLTPQEAVLMQAAQALTALKNQNMEQLAALAHPVQGVRFTPYAYVSADDLVFSPAQLQGLLADSTLYVWGDYDGIGGPIALNFADYYQKFIFDHDFTQAEAISLNARLGYGNSIDNSREFYADAFVVEYHFSGFDPDFQGMDWASLRLVFQEFEGRWVLVGVIHDQWTI